MVAILHLATPLYIVNKTACYRYPSEQLQHNIFILSLFSIL